MCCPLTLIEYKFSNLVGLKIKLGFYNIKIYVSVIFSISSICLNISEYCIQNIYKPYKNP